MIADAIGSLLVFHDGLLLADDFDHFLPKEFAKLLKLLGPRIGSELYRLQYLIRTISRSHMLRIQMLNGGLRWGQT